MQLAEGELSQQAIKQRGNTVSMIQIRLPKTVWQELVSLGQKEAASPNHLLEQAVRRFLEEKRRRGLAHKMLHESFGVWKDRNDLAADSTVVVAEMRQEWDEREQRLGLA